MLLLAAGGPARAAGSPDDAAPRAAELLRRGQREAERKDFAAAEADMRAALAVRPKDFDALCALTQFLRERGRMGDALAVAEVLVTVTEGIQPENRAEKWLQRAETLMRLRRYDDAVADVRRALADKPEDFPSLWLMAQILLRAGRPADALPFAERMTAAAASPAEKARAYSQRAQVRDALGDKKGGDEDVERALAAAPDDPAALEARSQRRRAEGRLDEALAAADRMVAAAATAPAARRAVLLQQRAQIRRERGDLPGAEADLRAALDAEPNALPALRSLTETLQLEGKSRESMEESARFLALATAHADAEGASPAARAAVLFKRGELKAALKDYPGAEADLRAGLALSPKDFYGLCTLTQFLRERGRLSESLAAADVLAGVTEGIPAENRAEKRLQRAETLMRMGRHAQARADIALALKEKPEDVPSLWLMTQSLLASGKAKEARPFADRMAAAAATPAEKARAFGQRAQVRDALGDKKGAEADVAAALAADPNDPAALEALVQRRHETGEREEDLALADRMVAAGAAAPAARRAVLLQQRAEVKRRRGDAAGAEADLRAALEAEPDSAQPTRNLAEILLDEGKAAAAADAASRYLALTREHDPALRASGLLLRARALDAAGRRSEAAADRAEAVRLAPGSAAVLREAAHAAGRTDEAFALSARMMAASTSAPDAERADALMERAGLLKAVGRRAEADRDLASALALAPGSLYALEQRVLIALDDKRPEDAEARVKELFDVVGSTSGRTHAAALALRAKVRAARGLQAESDRDFIAALAEDPTARDEIRARMDALSRQGHKEEMLAYTRRLLDEAAKAPPADPAAVRTVVEVLEETARQGRVDAALPYDGLLRARAPAAGDDAIRRRAVILLEHLGRARMEINDFPAAEADLRAGLAARPKDFDTLCTLVQFLRERGRLAESLDAAKVLATATDGIDPKNRAEKWLQRAETYLRMGRYRDAEADVARGLADKPEDLASLWLMTQVQFHAGTPARGLPYADRMLAAASTPAEKAHAYSQRAQLRGALGDKEGEEKDVARALAADPEDHIALEARVQRLRADGRPDEALALADRMVAAGASAPPARRAVLLEQRAQVRRALGDPRGAEADLRAALAVQPDALEPTRSLAEVQLDEGEPEKAAETATRALALSADAVAEVRGAALILRARAFDAAGARARAAADRAEAVRLAPASAPILRDAARAAAAPAEALALADRLVEATRAQPAAERASALLERAALLKSAGRREDARRDLSRALELAPASGDARAQLVLLALDEKRLDDAQALARGFFDVAASSAPGRARAAALTLRAKVLAARGRQDEADRDFLESLAEDPDATDELGARLAALARRGRREESLAYGRRMVLAAAAAPPGDARAPKTIADVVEELVREGRAAEAAEFDGALRARASAPSPRLRADVLLARAGLLEALGRRDEALSALRAAADAAPAEIEPRRRLAALLERLSRSREIPAVADAFVAVASSGTPAEAAQARLWRADRRAEAGDAAGAAADHAAAEAAVPGYHSRNPDVGAGWAALEAARAGRPAAWALLARLRSAAETPGARARLAAAEAESRWSAGDDAGARAAMAAALAAEPREACRAMLATERGKASVRWFDACLQRFPDDEVLLNDRGVALWLSGSRDAALTDFRRASALRPGFLSGALSLSTALEALGRPEEAARGLEAALSVPQADAALAGEARAALARLKAGLDGGGERKK